MAQWHLTATARCSWAQRLLNLVTIRLEFYAGYCVGETPRRISLGERRIEVTDGLSTAGWHPTTATSRSGAMTPESFASHTDLLRSMRGARQTLHFRSLIADWMSSLPVCVSAGSKVLSVVGQSRQMMVSGARRLNVHHAVHLAVITPRSHPNLVLQRKRRDRQHRRPGRDIRPAQKRNSIFALSPYATASPLVHHNSVPSVQIQ